MLKNVSVTHIIVMDMAAIETRVLASVTNDPLKIECTCSQFRRSPMPHAHETECPVYKRWMNPN